MMNLFENLQLMKENDDEFWNSKTPGYYGEQIFEMLDNLSGDHIFKFINEYNWNKRFGNYSDLHELYDKIHEYLDKYSGYDLYNDLSKFMDKYNLFESKILKDEEERDNEFFENLQLMKEEQNNFKSREELIDEIDKYYNKPGYIGDLSQNYKGTNMEWYEFVEKEIEKITGKSVEDLPDDDPDEGFYSNLSTSELIAVLNDINNVIDNLTKDNKTIIELTTQELNLIKTAMEMWSNTSFSKSREESDIAKDILNKLK